MVVARKQILVQLSDELVTLLDQEAGRRRISRSQLIREAIEQHAAIKRTAEFDQAYVESYTRFPQEPDPDAIISAIVAAKAMDEEEREAGLDPW